MKSPTLHLIMGLPGAGKSTLAKIIQNLTKASLLSSDEYRLSIFPKPTFSQQEHDSIYALIDHGVEHLLSSGHDVIYDANLNRKRHRQEKYRLAKKYNAEVKLWWVTTPKELSKKRRVSEQNKSLLPEGEKAENMFERIANILEAPLNDEICIKIDGTNIKTEDVEKYLK